MIKASFSLDTDSCKFCFKISTVGLPRSSFALVASSRSEPNWVNASSSLYEARSSLNVPETFLTAFIWALPPTLDTDRPALTAGLIPE